MFERTSVLIVPDTRFHILKGHPKCHTCQIINFVSCSLLVSSLPQPKLSKLHSPTTWPTRWFSRARALLESAVDLSGECWGCMSNVCPACAVQHDFHKLILDQWCLWDTQITSKQMNFTSQPQTLQGPRPCRLTWNGRVFKRASSTMWRPVMVGWHGLQVDAVAFVTNLI